MRVANCRFETKVWRETNQITKHIKTTSKYTSASNSIGHIMRRWNKVGAFGGPELIYLEMVVLSSINAIWQDALSDCITIIVTQSSTGVEVTMAIIDNDVDAKMYQETDAKLLFIMLDLFGGDIQRKVHQGNKDPCYSASICSKWFIDLDIAISSWLHNNQDLKILRKFYYQSWKWLYHQEFSTIRENYIKFRAIRLNFVLFATSPLRFYGKAKSEMLRRLAPDWA